MECCKKPDRESDKGTAASAPYLPGDLGAGTEDEGRLKAISGRKYQFGTSRLWRRLLRGFRSSTADSAKKGVAFRADYDALALPEGGAAPCCELFDKEEIEEIYGAHNLPGFAFGEVYTKEGTFACGSEGLTLRFIGKPTHAAYPELGISPAPAVGQILTGIPSFLNKKEHGYSGMALCTVIGVQMGEKAFGAAAEKAEVWLTLRAERGADLKKLCQMVLTRAEELAAQDGLILETEEQDVFPATENDSACAKKVLKVCGGRILQEPMRWSEDFGHYLNHCRGGVLRHRSRRGASGASHRDLRVPGRAAYADGGELFKAPVR